jgi:hypothetical protein
LSAQSPLATVPLETLLAEALRQECGECRSSSVTPCETHQLRIQDLLDSDPDRDLDDRTFRAADGTLVVLRDAA